MITLPVWYLALVAFSVFLFGLLLGARFGYGTPLCDRRSVGIITRTPDEWLQAVRAQAMAGDKPWGMTLSPRLLRAFFPGGLIINCPHPADLMKMGSPTAFITHVHSQPVRQASVLAGALQKEGGFMIDPDSDMPRVFEGQDIDPGLSPNRLAFVGTRLPFLLGYRRHALKMGRKPPGWNWQKAERSAREFVA